MINFKNVSKVYGKDIVALEDVTFEVAPGEFFFIVGHSGAGKSTLLRLLIRQEVPSFGNILFEEIDVGQIPRKMLSIYRQELGIVFQDLKLIPSKTVRENIQFPLQITNHSRKEILETSEYLLELIGLQQRADLFPSALSGGEKQKVAIARALANDPKLFIADEPTGNLDPDSAGEILQLLKSINSWGTTVMVVTHDAYIVDQMQTRVIHMEKGRLIEDKKGGYIGTERGRTESRK